MRPSLYPPEARGRGANRRGIELTLDNCQRDKLNLALPDWVFLKIEAAGIRLQS
jgi:hypothetical protein